MPIGSFACVPDVVAEMAAVAQRRGGAPLHVLDLGIGWGWLGCACRQWLDMGVVQPPASRTVVVGVEAWSPYASPAWAAYDAIEVRDIREAVGIWLGCARKFDVVALLDVIEHFDQAEGAALLADCQRLVATGGVLVVATPAIWFAQGAAYGNDAETHRSLWSPSDFPAPWRLLKDGSIDKWGHQMLCAAWTAP